ncbi:MAG TPA: hypothetical protein VIV60_28020 [Polyangiaceae bacterium]
MTDAITLEVARCAARSSDQAALLEGMGTLASRLTAEIYRDAPAQHLHLQAQGIHCVVQRGMAILAELNREAGRLEVLATMRSAASGHDEV